MRENIKAQRIKPNRQNLKENNSPEGYVSGRNNSPVGNLSFFVFYPALFCKAGLWRLLPFIFCLLPLFCFSQKEKQTLENKKKSLQEDIEYQNKILKETTKNKQLSLSQLIIINKNISVREELIATINLQVRDLGYQIDETTSLVEAMENDLRILKAEYAGMVYHAYKNRGSYDKMVFIFSAKDFNQAYKRLKYYEQYTEYRKNQAILIVKTQESLKLNSAELETKKHEKQVLLESEKQEKLNLTATKEQQQNTFKQIQSKEKQLKEDIKKKQSEIEKLQKAIEEAIRKEMEEQKKKGFFAMTPEMKELSAGFENNKGKLPWPVVKGVITEWFGEHDHPVLKGIRIKNNGLEIETTPGSAARAVFDGEVSKVIIIPGSGKAILVRHGEYLSVYFKLQEAFVKPGDKVKVKQEIGSIITDETSGKTELHFEIWKGKVILNPEEWIYKAN